MPGPDSSEAAACSAPLPAPAIPPQRPHPWDVTCTDYFATAPAGTAIKHDAALATLPLRALAPPQDYDTEEKKASYYQHACQIEQAYQLTLLPYSVAIDPDVQDKSYHGIMSRVYKTWAKRMIKHRCEMASAPREVKELTEAQIDDKASQGSHSEWLRKLANVVLCQLEAEDIEYQSATDEMVKRKMCGYALLVVLRTWTNEWHRERRALDPQGQYLIPEALDPARENGAPFSTVRPESLDRKGNTPQV